MQADLAELIKEIGRLAETHEDNTEWYKIVDFCKIMPIFDESELGGLSYHQFQLAVEIYAIAYSQCVNDPGDDWGTVKMFANMVLGIDRAKVESQ